jgi:hypothetical protein
VKQKILVDLNLPRPPASALPSPQEEDLPHLTLDSHNGSVSGEVWVLRADPQGSAAAQGDTKPARESVRLNFHSQNGAVRAIVVRRIYYLTPIWSLFMLIAALSLLFSVGSTSTHRRSSLDRFSASKSRHIMARSRSRFHALFTGNLHSIQTTVECTSHPNSLPALRPCPLTMGLTHSSLVSDLAVEIGILARVAMATRWMG